MYWQQEKQTSVSIWVTFTRAKLWRLGPEYHQNNTYQKMVQGRKNSELVTGLGRIPLKTYWSRNCWKRFMLARIKRCCSLPQSRMPMLIPVHGWCSLHVNHRIWFIKFWMCIHQISDLVPVNNNKNICSSGKDFHYILESGCLDFPHKPQEYDDWVSTHRTVTPQI